MKIKLSLYVMAILTIVEGQHRPQQSRHGSQQSGQAPSGQSQYGQADSPPGQSQYGRAPAQSPYGQAAAAPTPGEGQSQYGKAPAQSPYGQAAAAPTPGQGHSRQHNQAASGGQRTNDQSSGQSQYQNPSERGNYGGQNGKPPQPPQPPVAWQNQNGRLAPQPEPNLNDQENLKQEIAEVRYEVNEALGMLKEVEQEVKNVENEIRHEALIGNQNAEQFAELLAESAAADELNKAYKLSVPPFMVFLLLLL